MSQTTTSQDTRRNASPTTQSGEELRPRQDFVEYLKEYAREKPDVAALWCFGIGFVLGWKVKPW